MKYQEETESINKQIRGLQSLRRQILNKWTEAEHPLKVGDVVEVNSFFFRGEKIKVREVSVNKGRASGWAWIAIGPILKKDGSLGLRDGVWTSMVEE